MHEGKKHHKMKYANSTRFEIRIPLGRQTTHNQCKQHKRQNPTNIHDLTLSSEFKNLNFLLGFLENGELNEIVNLIETIN